MRLGRPGELEGIKLYPESALRDIRQIVNCYYRIPAEFQYEEGSLKPLQFDDKGDFWSVQLGEDQTKAAYSRYPSNRYRNAKNPGARLVEDLISASWKFVVCATDMNAVVHSLGYELDDYERAKCKDFLEKVDVMGRTVYHALKWMATHMGVNMPPWDARFYDEGNCYNEIPGCHLVVYVADDPCAEVINLQSRADGYCQCRVSAQTGKFLFVPNTKNDRYIPLHGPVRLLHELAEAYVTYHTRSQESDKWWAPDQEVNYTATSKNSDGTSEIFPLYNEPHELAVLDVENPFRERIWGAEALRRVVAKMTGTHLVDAICMSRQLEPTQKIEDPDSCAVSTLIPGGASLVLACLREARDGTLRQTEFGFRFFERLHEDYYSLSPILVALARSCALLSGWLSTYLVVPLVSFWVAMNLRSSGARPKDVEEVFRKTLGAAPVLLCSEDVELDHARAVLGHRPTSHLQWEWRQEDVAALVRRRWWTSPLLRWAVLDPTIRALEWVSDVVRGRNLESRIQVYAKGWAANIPLWPQLLEGLTIREATESLNILARLAGDEEGRLRIERRFSRAMCHRAGPVF